MKPSIGPTDILATISKPWYGLLTVLILLVGNQVFPTMMYGWIGPSDVSYTEFHWSLHFEEALSGAPGNGHKEQEGGWVEGGGEIWSRLGLL